MNWNRRSFEWDEWNCEIGSQNCLGPSRLYHHHAYEGRGRVRMHSWDTLISTVTALCSKSLKIIKQKRERLGVGTGEEET
jgi:hypothetical protein